MDLIKIENREQFDRWLGPVDREGGFIREVHTLSPSWFDEHLILCDPEAPHLVRVLFVQEDAEQPGVELVFTEVQPGHDTHTRWSTVSYRPDKHIRGRGSCGREEPTDGDRADHGNPDDEAVED